MPFDSLIKVKFRHIKRTCIWLIVYPIKFCDKSQINKNCCKNRKKVTPRIIKPSSIIIDFENRINPEIIQHKARHNRIETTLRYDHTDSPVWRKNISLNLT